MKENKVEKKKEKEIKNKEDREWLARTAKPEEEQDFSEYKFERLLKP